MYTKRSMEPSNTPIPTPQTTGNNDEANTLNLYPIIRHLFLTLCILLAVAIILFLMYQNGKSIYDKGI